MNEAVEFIDSRFTLVKSKFGEFGAVDRLVGIKNFASKALDDFLVHRFAWPHQFVGDLICVDAVGAEVNEDLADQRLSGSDTARKADFKHDHLRSQNSEARMQK